MSDSFVQALEKQLFILCCKLLTDVGVGDYKFGDSRGLVPFGNGLEQLCCFGAVRLYQFCWRCYDVSVRVAFQ